MRSKNKKRDEKEQREDKKKKKRSHSQPKQNENKLRLPKATVQTSLVVREYVFLEEIGKMMYTFGDVRNPLEESIKIIESYVKKQVLTMLNESEGISLLRDTKVVDVQDVTFLFRKDITKLTRIERFLKSKDKSQRSSSQKRKRPSVTDSLFEDISDEEDKFCLDEYDMKRLTANDIITKDMTLEEYMDWSRCKEATFVTSKKFREWIGFDSRITDKVIELFGYLAWEIVGLICQASLIVKREMEHRLNDTQFLTIGIATGVMNESLRDKLSYVTDMNVSKPNIGTHKKPLQPICIYEAVRRLASIKQFY